MGNKRRHRHLILNVDTRDTVVMTNKLEKLHRSAFPLAVRGALNKAAFNTKGKTLLQTTEKTFTNRQKNFFRANSKVFMAKGWDVRKMVSEVGMVEGKLKGDKNYAVKDLAQQERGGSIGGRSFIPISSGARVGGSYGRNVKRKLRIGQNVGSIVDSKKTRGNSKAQKYIAAAYQAGKGGLVLGNRSNGNSRTVFEIRGLKKVKGFTKIKSIPVYSYSPNRKVKVKATKFMERSGEISGRQMAKFYNEEGQRQINRLMRK